MSNLPKHRYQPHPPPAENPLCQYPWTNSYDEDRCFEGEAHSVHEVCKGCLNSGVQWRGMDKNIPWPCWCEAGDEMKEFFL